ncbi:hypothetical protein [Halalkalibacterium halodurans]|uniref:hypothetical protein n=1 Tax=Halalkalibacterium halodurans TaxID=86665 RepID=UPI002AA9BDAB|nr:hypothetical protein [Halalkalibacterium halodurans]MDY7221471.1 hypothetical protein [Halalkalibacterium halodurans]MDY7240710.1 hypothetical protein [Halalkalibacterium halodurans]
MELYELKPYILESCHFLGMKVHQMTTSKWKIFFPEKYRDEFNGQEEMVITFEKTNDPHTTYITFESYFTQKIAQLVAEYNSGVSSGTITTTIQTHLDKLKDSFPDCNLQVTSSVFERSDFIMVWFKTTVNLYLTEEYLKGFKYSLKTGTFENVPSEEKLNDFLDEIKEEQITDISYDLIDGAIQKLYAIAQEDAQTFITEKLKDHEATLQKEINRINEYYDLLESENELAESSKGLTPEEELALLKKERKNLIDQQIKKSRIQQQEVTIEPVAILLLKENNESAKVTVESSFGTVNIDLISKTESNINCSVTNESIGPFTITSDNLIAKTNRVFKCSNCHKCLGDHKKKTCVVCSSELCDECKEVSAISHSTLCHNHATECQSCLHTISAEELNLCANCNQFYCTDCNPSGKCHICNSFKPVVTITPQLHEILKSLPENMQAKKFDVSERGNRINLLGKGLIFKSFLIVYDKTSHSIIYTDKYNLFGRKSK